MKPKNLEKVKPFQEKNTTEINEVESTPLAKRNKEEQLWQHSGRERDAQGMIKRKELEQKGTTLRLDG